MLLSPWLPLALTAGLAAQHVSTRSLQTGDAVSVTAMTGLTVNVLNIVGGILIFGDPFANSLAGVLAEATAFSLICAATFPTPVPELGDLSRPRPADGMSSIRADIPGDAPQAQRQSTSVSPARTSESTGQIADPRLAADRAPAVIGLLAAAGSGLLIAGELTDALEADLGLTVFNLLLSSLLAVLIVSTGALVGDSLLTAVNNRFGWQPNRRLITASLMFAGAPVTIWILIGHFSRPLRLDGGIGLAGGVMLVLAALAHHGLPHHASATTPHSGTADVNSARSAAMRHPKPHS